jgi:TPR repeat protein
MKSTMKVLYLISVRALLVQACLVLLLSACNPMNAFSDPFTSKSDIALLSEKGVLPRNINLKAFEPHSESFTCAQATTNAPVLSPAGQELFEEGMAITSPALWPNERNWPRAMQVWEQAMKLGHWKAALMWIQTAKTGNGLNSEKGQFQVAAQNPELVVKLVEQLMQQNVADAFYLMGDFHSAGYGVKRDVGRAWAFWELAADKGSPRAQTQIANALGLGRHDMEKPDVAEWANQKVMFQMLECAYAQGYGKAGYELGAWLNINAQTDDLDGEKKQAQFARARKVLHDATKFGSEDAANSLAVAFSGGRPLVMNAKDPARAKRYSLLGDALFNNPDLRFPNLDKVLPLPPAALPKWDSKPESLIEAAQGVRAPPKPPPTFSSHSPQSRAHLPAGTALAMPSNLSRIPVLPGYTSILASQPVSTGLARAPIAGYWQAKVLPASPNESPYVSSLRGQLAHTPPMRFIEGERMQLTMGNTNLLHEDMTHYLVEWHFVGRPAPLHAPQDWLAQAGAVRAIAAATDITCKGDKPCPQTGIWQPYLLDAAHPLSKVLGAAPLNDGWKWQAFVQEGQALPSLQALGIEDAKLDWRLMQATALGFDV